MEPMKNFLQDGNVLTLPAPVGGITSGAGMVAGKFFGIASTDAAAGAPVECAVVGVYELAAIGPIVQGGLCYWDSAVKKITATPTGKHPCGRRHRGRRGRRHPRQGEVERRRDGVALT
jgi:predicted RecA/RadA family phage recombinase